MESQFTIDTLERMFVYLGCANIATQKAMDGAIPIHSMLGCNSEVVAELEPAKLSELPLNWSIKTTWFSGDDLAMSTASNVHWSIINGAISRGLRVLRQFGHHTNQSTTAHVSAYVAMFYSEISSDGRFRKFKVAKRKHGAVSVTGVFNPSWLLAFEGERMRCMESQNDFLYKEKRIGFLSPFMCGLAQSVRSYWQVKTRFDEVCPSLTLLTDPTGVKEFWKLRDIPEGKKRRDALLHWVESHWRQTRSDPDVEAYVRKHLRGSEDITQGNFKATVVASETDKLDIEVAIKDREAMRVLKTDRRKRSRILQNKSAK
jgi:hypothetical protein